MPAGLRRYWAAKRRRRHAYARNEPARHHRRRRSYARNEPARRRRRYAGGGLGGLPTFAHLLPAVGTGVAAGLGLGFAMPYVARWFNLTPVGLMYRAAQGGAAFAIAWGLRSLNVLSRENAGVFAAYGLAFAGLGLVQDFQMGVLMPATAPAVSMADILRGGEAPTPFAPAALGYSYGTEPAGGEPYGSAYMGYYEAVSG